MVYGYNLEAPVPYFLLKNNWGTNWGDLGYYKVKIGDLKENNYGLCLIAHTVYNTMPVL